LIDSSLLISQEVFKGGFGNFSDKAKFVYMTYKKWSSIDSTQCLL